MREEEGRRQIAFLHADDPPPEYVVCPHIKIAAEEAHHSDGCLDHEYHGDLNIYCSQCDQTFSFEFGYP